MSELLDHQSALAQGYLPIREVTRRTGVIPGTLRAWERRYGLVVPMRTNKGHRLYAPEQIERIQQIVIWLNRGVPVSQVAELLEDATVLASGIPDIWRDMRDNFGQCISKQSLRHLDEAFNKAQAVYPPKTLCSHLLLPLIDELNQRWRELSFGARLEEVFFHSWLRSKIGARLLQDHRYNQGSPVLLVSQSHLHIEPGLWLCAWLLSCSGVPVKVFEPSVPGNELMLAVENIAPRALVLYSSQSLSPFIRQQLLRLLDNCNVPLLLAGPAATIHQAEFGSLSDLQLALDPLQAEGYLREKGILDQQASYTTN